MGLKLWVKWLPFWLIEAIAQKESATKPCRITWHNGENPQLTNALSYELTESLYLISSDEIVIKKDIEHLERELARKHDTLKKEIEEHEAALNKARAKEEQKKQKIQQKQDDKANKEKARLEYKEQKQQQKQKPKQKDNTKPAQQKQSAREPEEGFEPIEGHEFISLEIGDEINGR